MNTYAVVRCKIKKYKPLVGREKDRGVFQVSKAHFHGNCYCETYPGNSPSRAYYSLVFRKLTFVGRIEWARTLRYSQLEHFDFRKEQVPWYAIASLPRRNACHR
jgi:hypothetical protein